MNRNIFVKILLICTFLFTFPNIVYGVDVVKRTELNLEESLSEENQIYSNPQKILVSQVEGFNPKLSNNMEEWIQLLYYYSVTRLNLNDIPYNYLIDAEGRIYEGAKGGVGVNPGLDGGENVVLVGVLDSKSSPSLRTQDSLIKLVESLSLMYGVKEGSWDFVDLKIQKQKDSFSFLTISESSKPFKETLTNVFNQVKWSTQEKLDFKASIQSVEYEKDVVIGQRLKVKAVVKNENDFTWFTTPNYIYVSTKDSVDSVHAINSEWASASKPTYIEKAFVKPNETVEVQFDLLAKSKPGEYTESFFLMKSAELTVSDSSFDVKFNIVKGDNTIVELVSPEYGFVNIRECRWYSCEKVEVANEGDVFITTKKEEGWYEVIYGDDKRGWVYQKYTREL